MKNGGFVFILLAASFAFWLWVLKSPAAANARNVYQTALQESQQEYHRHAARWDQRQLEHDLYSFLAPPVRGHKALSQKHAGGPSNGQGGAPGGGAPHDPRDTDWGRGHGDGDLHLHANGASSGPIRGADGADSVGERGESKAGDPGTNGAVRDGEGGGAMAGGTESTRAPLPSQGQGSAALDELGRGFTGDFVMHREKFRMHPQLVPLKMPKYKIQCLDTVPPRGCDTSAPEGSPERARGWERLGLVTKPFLESLPPVDALRQEGIYNLCAVVGNGGSLLLHKWGADIDAHDAVFRFNGGVTQGFQDHVGQKTTIRLVNSQHFAFHEGESEIVLQHVTSSESLRSYIRMRTMDPRFKFYIIDGDFVNHVLNATEWTGAASNGFFGINLAYQRCRNITLYGFNKNWKAEKDMEAQGPPSDKGNAAARYHYYDKVCGLHAMRYHYHNKVCGLPAMMCLPYQYCGYVW
eukprot:jgi/Mesvir1/18415/Mv14285-RA.2